MKIKQYEPLLMTLFRASDGFIGVLLWGCLFFLVGGGGKFNVKFSIVLFIIILISFSSFGLYQSWLMESVYKEFKKLIQGCFIVCFILFTIIYLLELPLFIPRRVILSWMVVCPTVLFVQRATVRSLLRYYQKRGRNIKRAVIVGRTDIGQYLEHLISENPWLGTKILGYFDDSFLKQVNENSFRDLREGLLDFVHNNNVDIIYIALPMREERKINYIIDKISRVVSCSIYLVPSISFSNPIDINGISLIENMMLFQVADMPFNGINAVVKRAEDIVLGTLFLLISSPVMLITAIVIKLTSSSQIVFKQWRYGFKGRHIQIWKFRTLTVSENGNEVKQVVNCDSRLTKIGTYLRKMSIDELPQFINVLQGRMSIVGPRPHVPKFVDNYCNKGYATMLRLNVKPGITGLAQLYGTRKMIIKKEEIEERYRYDLEYINNWSLWLDMKIIFLTIHYLFKKNKNVL